MSEKESVDQEAEATKQEESTQAEATAETTADDTKAEEKTVEEEVEKTPEMIIQELNDKYLRLYSEFDNYRKRTQREKIDVIRNAGADVIKDILPIIDDFERATAAHDNSSDEEALKEGLKLIHQKLVGILERKGVKPMNSIGEPFNVDHHEAITKIPAPSEDMKGKVVDAVEKGYFLKDRVLRYAKVVVGN